MKRFFVDLYEVFHVAFVRVTGGDADALLLAQSNDQPLDRVATTDEMIG